MKRTNIQTLPEHPLEMWAQMPNFKVDAILGADFHLREDLPVCRTDNFEAAQWRKLDEIKVLQKKHNCPVYHAGDLFQHWKPSPSLLSKTIQHLPAEFYTVYGNHDLPQHNMELLEKSGVFTLYVAGKINILPKGHFGEVPQHSITIKGKRVGICHIMTYKGNLPFPGCKSPLAAALLNRHKDIDMLLTGDNHQSFTQIYDGRLLVNPGSLTRHKADQVNHRPAVYLWNAETNTALPHYLGIENNVISREHIEVQEQRDKRIDAFISGLTADWSGTLNFKDNLKIFFAENNTSENLQNIIMNAIKE